MDNADRPIPPDTSKVSDDSPLVTPVFGLGRLAPFNFERYSHATKIRPFWGRIVLWLLLLGSVGWVTLATGVYSFVKYRRGFSEVSYQHMLLLPWKLDDYRRAKGEFVIKQGLELAERQEWRAAFTLLRTGLLAVPEHREARLMVARLYLMAGRPDVVRTTLKDGLAHHGDELDYLRQVLGFFFTLQADNTVIDLTVELRGRLDATSPAYRMATTALAYAYFNRDRYTEAESVLRDSRLLGTPEGRFVMARIAWEQGRRAEAVGQLRALTAQVPDDYEIYRTLIFYLKEDGRWGEVRRASLSRQFALPDRPEAYVDFMIACSKEEDEERRAEAEAAFFERFGGDTKALLKLADEAARTGQLATVRRVVAICKELSRDEVDATFFLITAQLVRRDYDTVATLCEKLIPVVSTWPERQQLIFGGLRAVALYSQGHDFEAEPMIRRICETRMLPVPNLTALAEQLKQAGHRAEARRVLRHAVEVDPLNQAALVLLMRDLLAENQLDKMPALIDRLLVMRKPPADILRTLGQVLDSDLYLFHPGREPALAKVKSFLGKSKSSTDAR